MVTNRLVDADSNLILTGYAGPNLPALSKSVAARLGRPLVAVETLLEERADAPLKELRERYGQARLKTLEAAVMEEVVLYRGTVIRIGGGILANGDALARLAATGPVLCLVARLDAVLRQLHLAMGNRYHDPAVRDLTMGQLKQAWAVRGNLAVHELDVTGCTDDEIVDLMAQQWQALAIRRG